MGRSNKVKPLCDRHLEDSLDRRERKDEADEEEEKGEEDDEEDRLGVMKKEQLNGKVDKMVNKSRDAGQSTVELDSEVFGLLL